jgi:hypothetical protein
VRIASTWPAILCNKPKAQSHARINKERAMRRRKLKWLWARLKEIAAMDLDREELLMKLGAARARAWAAWRLVNVEAAPEGAFLFLLEGVSACFLALGLRKISLVGLAALILRGAGLLERDGDRLAPVLDLAALSGWPAL